MRHVFILSALFIAVHAGFLRGFTDLEEEFQARVDDHDFRNPQGHGHPAHFSLHKMRGAGINNVNNFGRRRVGMRLDLEQQLTQQ